MCRSQRKLVKIIMDAKIVIAGKMACWPLILSDSSMTRTAFDSYFFQEAASATIRLSGGSLLDWGRGISRA